MVVDCRGLIEFCRSFDHRRTIPKPQPDHHHHHRSCCRRRSKSLNPLSHPFCEHSPFAAIDIIILLLALAALAVLAFPYIRFILHSASELLPLTLEAIGGLICDAPVAYLAGFALTFLAAIAGVAVSEVMDHRSRRCGNLNCKGLRKAVEFDIQLESEECVRYLMAVPEESARPLDLGKDHRELEAELKKMAPLNGRTVLVFRAPCGCPTGRMEVWGAKKVRRIKK